MTCDSCGAPIKDDGAFCSHCGARVAKPERTDTALKAATDPARFDLARASGGYQTAMSYAPHVPVAGVIAMPIMLGLAGVVFLVFSQSMTWTKGDELFRAFFVLAPLAFIAIAIGIAVKARRYARAPLRKEVCVVVDERTEVSSSGDNMTTTRYYATLQYRDGMRIEYRTFGWVAGAIAATDIGVAYLKGNMLVDFQRLST